MIEWLDDFYGSEDMRDTLLRSYLPVFSNYVSEAVGPVSSSFVRALAEGYVERHLGSSRAQLQEIVKDSENPVVDLAARFDEWEEKRPRKVSTNETVRAANAATLEQMRASGVTHKKWVTQGTCAFCAEMAGRTTTIEKTFLGPGDALHPEGVETAMTIKAPVGHPPLHRACRCSVEPVEISVRSTAESAAADLISGVQGVEPQVTKTLDEIGQRTRGTLRGLQNRLKTEESMARKIAKDVADHGMTVEQASGQIYDGLRYTYEFAPSEYAAGVTGARADLLARGYTQVRDKNFWTQDGYAAVQDVFKAPNGTYFELQYHTPATLVAKDPSHKLFNVQRQLPLGDPQRDVIQSQIDALWEPVRSSMPPGVLDL